MAQYQVAAPIGRAGDE